MDAAEADFDAKLYKASADLIPELQTKLPQLIWHNGKAHIRLRTHVLLGKCADLEFNVRFCNALAKKHIDDSLSLIDFKTGPSCLTLYWRLSLERSWMAS